MYELRTDLFVSDYSVVIAKLEMKRDDIRKVTKTIRSLTHLTCCQLSEETNYMYSDDSTLEEQVACFEKESRRCLEKLPPTKTGTVIERKTNGVMMTLKTNKKHKQT